MMNVLFFHSQNRQKTFVVYKYDDGLVFFIFPKLNSCWCLFLFLLLMMIGVVWGRVMLELFVGWLVGESRIGQFISSFALCVRVCVFK
jgi:hypothetical protein